MKTLDTCKYHVSNGVLTLSNALFSHSIQGVDRAVASVKDAGGLSVPYLEVCALSGVRNHTASFAFFMYSFNHFKKLQYFANRLESIVAKRKCL